MVNGDFLLQLTINNLPLSIMRLFYFLLFTFCLLLMQGCNPAAPVSISNNSTIKTNNPLPPAKPVEEMYWMKFDGETQKLKDLQGKAVILDFWATYCPPCIEEIPHLKELQKKHGKENLEIVGLHTGGDEDRPQVPAFVKKLGIDYTLATPENALVSFVFGNDDSIPQTVIFDRKGNMVKKFVGFSPDIKKEMDAAVEKAVSSK